jgi:hypothetical protein
MPQGHNYIPARPTASPQAQPLERGSSRSRHPWPLASGALLSRSDTRARRRSVSPAHRRSAAAPAAAAACAGRHPPSASARHPRGSPHAAPPGPPPPLICRWAQRASAAWSSGHSGPARRRSGVLLRGHRAGPPDCGPECPPSAAPQDAMMRQLALAALLALASTAAAARPPLECIAASTVVPTDGSFSLFPKQFHMISSTGAAQASTALSTTVRRSRCRRAGIRPPTAATAARLRQSLAPSGPAGHPADAGPRR